MSSGLGRQDKKTIVSTWKIIRIQGFLRASFKGLKSPLFGKALFVILYGFCI